MCKVTLSLFLLFAEPALLTPGSAFDLCVALYFLFSGDYDV
ncbi:hypothetical protein MRBBS_1239 [Marinobacter sp. BSs20148]|nr:hypothetical protein MRBBS_1239 [Marinobacter sp. BSs20148]